MPLTDDTTGSAALPHSNDADLPLENDCVDLSKSKFQLKEDFLLGKEAADTNTNNISDFGDSNLKPPTPTEHVEPPHLEKDKSAFDFQAEKFTKSEDTKDEKSPLLQRFLSQEWSRVEGSDSRYT